MIPDDKGAQITGFPVIADDLAIEVCKAIGINPDDVSRVIIDLKTGFVAVVYVEMFGSERLLDVQWDLLHGAKIVTSEGEQ